jgi:hypothetical protein
MSGLMLLAISQNATPKKIPPTNLLNVKINVSRIP